MLLKTSIFLNDFMNLCFFNANFKIWKRRKGPLVREKSRFSNKKRKSALKIAFAQIVLLFFSEFLKNRPQRKRANQNILSILNQYNSNLHTFNLCQITNLFWFVFILELYTNPYKPVQTRTNLYEPVQTFEYSTSVKDVNTCNWCDSAPFNDWICLRCCECILDLLWICSGSLANLLWISCECVFTYGSLLYGVWMFLCGILNGLFWMCCREYD